MKHNKYICLSVGLLVLLGLVGCKGKPAGVMEPAPVSAQPTDLPQTEVIITDIGLAAVPQEEQSDTPDYFSDQGDENALYAAGENQRLSGILINKTGDASNDADSFGKNAAILVEDCELTFMEGTIYTDGIQSEGMMAIGSQSSILAENVSVHTEGEQSPGIRLLDGGRAQIRHSSVSTEMATAPALQIGGDFLAEDSKFRAAESRCLVLESGSNTALFRCELIGEQAMLYRDTAANGKKGHLIMEGCLIATGEDAILQMEQGELELHLKKQQLTGSLDAGTGALTLILEDKSVFCGVINGEDPRAATIILDGTSIWTVTEDTYVGVLINTDASFSNIVSNGFTVYYDSSLEANVWLDSKSYSLPGGGYLVPLI